MGTGKPATRKGQAETASTISLTEAPATFGGIDSPRTIGRVNCDLKIAHATGERAWHVHDHAGGSFW
ncbi:MAG TPA: hypothetical protein VKV38_10780 [Trebonia sp.]|jgi:hypothetical protein|nr:hypothetical protein [Trebonia sp.]